MQTFTACCPRDTLPGGETEVRLESFTRAYQSHYTGGRHRKAPHTPLSKESKNMMPSVLEVEPQRQCSVPLSSYPTWWHYGGEVLQLNQSWNTPFIFPPKFLSLLKIGNTMPREQVQPHQKALCLYQNLTISTQKENQKERKSHTHFIIPQKPTHDPLLEKTSV